MACVLDSCCTTALRTHVAGGLVVGMPRGLAEPGRRRIEPK